MILKNAGSMIILVAVPSGGRRVTLEWGLCLAAQNYPINAQICFKGLRANPEWREKGVMTTAHQRNELVKEALSINAKYIFFMDDDTSPPPATLRNMFHVAEQMGPPHDNVMAVTGVYVTKRDPPEPLLFHVKHQGALWDWTVGDVFEVTACGAGCLIINTQVFKELPEPWFKGEHGTEDLYFCDTLVQAGYRIMCHGGVLCAHWDAETDKAWVLPPDSLPFRRLYGIGPEIKIDKAMGIAGFDSSDGNTYPMNSELAWLGKQAKSHHCIVEIGSYLGRSTRALADNTEGHVHAIDDWKGPRDQSISKAERGDLLDRFKNNMSDLNGRLRIHVEDHATAEVGETPDMVFIDGSHEEQDIRRDISRWLDRLQPGGLICGHDYMECWPSVRNAVDDLVSGAEVAPNTTIWFATKK